MIRCTNCNTPAEQGGVFCGHCGQQISSTEWQASINTSPEMLARLQAQRQPTGGFNRLSSYQHPSQSGPVQAYPRTPISQVGRVVTNPPSRSQIQPSRPPSVVPTTEIPTPKTKSEGHPIKRAGRNLVFLGIIFALVGVGIAASVFTLWQNQSKNTLPVGNTNASGTVSFYDSQVNPISSNSLQITVSGLAQTNDRYVAWLINNSTDQVIRLGLLERVNGSQYTLQFTDSQKNLFLRGDLITITQESGEVSLPTGPMILSGQIPPKAFVHLKHLMTEYSGSIGNVGLLIALREQSALLYGQSQILKTASDRETIRCLTQNMLNLVEGEDGKDFSLLPEICAKKKIDNVGLDPMGLLGAHDDGYAASSAVHASLAATQSDATDTIRKNAQKVVVTSDNVRQWLDLLRETALDVLQNPTKIEKIGQMVTLAEYILNGVDKNKNGIIETVQGEGGASSAYLSAQAMAAMTLTVPKHNN